MSVQVPLVRKATEAGQLTQLCNALGRAITWRRRDDDGDTRRVRPGVLRTPPGCCRAFIASRRKRGQPSADWFGGASLSEMSSSRNTGGRVGDPSLLSGPLIAGLRWRTTGDGARERTRACAECGTRPLPANSPIPARPRAADRVVVGGSMGAVRTLAHPLPADRIVIGHLRHCGHRRVQRQRPANKPL